MRENTQPVTSAGKLVTNAKRGKINQSGNQCQMWENMLRLFLDEHLTFLELLSTSNIVIKKMLSPKPDTIVDAVARKNSLSQFFFVVPRF